MSSIVGQDGGGKGPEGFPEFDFGVDNILHFGISGVGQDASVTQRPGTPFEAALEPTNDLAFDDFISDIGYQLIIRQLRYLHLGGVEVAASPPSEVV